MPTVTAVVVSGGSSTRMGKDKQFIPVGGVPALVRSMLVFESVEEIGETVVVTRAESVAEVERLARQHGVSKLRMVVPGGNTRQQSVEAGICAAGDCDYYAIHDGARPLVKAEDIRRVIADAVQHGAAALGVPVKDTVKRVSADGTIETTVDRSALYLIQTPQVFHAGQYQKALQMARDSAVEYTDDCQLFEEAGLPVHVTKGSGTNIKLTTPEDCILAQALWEE